MYTTLTLNWRRAQTSLHQKYTASHWQHIVHHDKKNYLRFTKEKFFVLIFTVPIAPYPQYSLETSKEITKLISIIL